MSQITNIQNGLRLIIYSAFFILHSSLVAQDDLNITLTPGATNILRLQTAATTSDLYRIFESTPPSIGNQIDLRYSAAFEITPIAIPSGWQFQNVTLNNGEQEKVATWFYQGVDPTNPAESVNLATPLDLQYQIHALTSTTTTVSVRVEAQVSVYSTEFDLTFSGIIFEATSPTLISSSLRSFRETYNLPADGSADQLDRSGNSLPNIFSYAFGLGDPGLTQVDRTRLPRFISPNQFTYIRHIDQINDGLNTLLQVSSDLTNWDPILPSTPEVITNLDATHQRVTLTLPQTETQQFYRLALTIE